MASLTKRVRDGATTWVVRWRETDGVQRKKSFDRKADAEDFETTIRASLRDGSYVRPDSKLTVAEYAREWAASRPHRPRTAERTASFIEHHIAPTRLGRTRLAAVRPSQVQTWATDRSTVLAPSTLRSLVSLLRSIYGAAVLDRLVATSPVVRVTLPRHERPRVVPLTVEQVSALAEAVPPRNRAMVVTQAGLGLRVGELLGLQVDDVDFLRRTVRVQFQLDDDTNTRVDVKTPQSRRTLPLPQVVADALAAHLVAHPAPTGGWLFSTKSGRPYHQDYYGSQIFKAAVKAAGLPGSTSSHDLRHHFASVLLHAGESVVAVAERLGHENASLVLSTYGHLMPGSEERTRRAVDEAWAATASLTSSAPSAPQGRSATP